MSNFVEELKWRGMIHDVMPGTEEQLLKEMTGAYVGIDPTADSLHIGHLVSIMMLKHFQVAGHKPFILLGGATGMIGDPSGKSAERNLLTEEILAKYQAGIKGQVMKFLDFDSKASNTAELVNNYDWMKNFSFLNFIRDVGKHITVNYMMSKDSVKKRLSAESSVGMSFTEFTYQLVQGNDFLHLYKEKNCKIQMGGSDQWGNITTGTEMIRRMTAGKAYAITCPLITKADGGKFGKTESGNIWLSPEKTSPYKFLQFWLNTSDDDAEKYIKIFTLLNKEEISNLIKEHRKNPHLRLVQQKLAEQVTTMVHSKEEYDAAMVASNILFGKATSEELKKISEDDFLAVFEGVPQANVAIGEISEGLSIINALSEKSSFLKSKGEARRALKENSISVNKDKVNEDFVINKNNLIKNKYILLQRGKKNYFLLVIE